MLGGELREDGKHETGMMVYAWFWFKRGYNGLATIDHLDNDNFILKGKENGKTKKKKED